MRKRNKLGLGMGLALSGAIFASHMGQVSYIENRCNQNIQASQNSIRDDLNAIIMQVARETNNDKGGLKFIIGDFDITEDGSARCGGIARRVCELGAERGFESDIVFMIHGTGAHYYAILTRDGQSFEVGKDCLTYNEL